MNYDPEAAEQARAKVEHQQAESREKARFLATCQPSANGHPRFPYSPTVETTP